jgi:hypothetical protein
MKLENFRQIFENYYINKLNGTSFLWEPSCSMRTDGRMGGGADMKPIVSFRHFANAAKNVSLPKEGAVAARLYDSTLFTSTAI